MKTITKKTRFFGTLAFKKIIHSSTIFLLFSALGFIAASIIASKEIGTYGISAVVISIPFILLSNALGIMASSGTVILISKALAREEKDSASKLFGQSIILSVIFGGLLAIIFAILKNNIALLFYPNFDFYDILYNFFDGIIVAIALIPVSHTLALLLREDNDRVLAIIATIIKVIVGLILGLILARQLGSFGLALSYGIAEGVSILVMICHFFRKNKKAGFKFCLNGAFLKQSIIISLPDFSGMILMAASCFILNICILSWFGHDAHAVFSIVFCFFNICSVFAGIGQALAGQLLDYQTEGNKECCVKLLNKTLIYTVVEGIVFGLIMFGLSWAIPYIFSIPSKYIELCKIACLCLAGVMPFGAVFAFYMYYYRIIGKSMDVIIINCLSIIVFDTCLPLFFGFILNNPIWMFVSLAGGAVAKSAIAILSVVLRSKKEMGGWLINDYDASVYNYDFNLVKDEIMQVRDLIDNELREKEFMPKRTLNRISLAIEEYLLMTLESNKSSKLTISCEVSVYVREFQIDLVIRDSGKIVKESDDELLSFRKYVFTQLVEARAKRTGLVPTINNRIALSFPFKSDDSGNKIDIE